MHDIKHTFRNEKNEALITELKATATRMESLLRRVPTTEAKILGELYTIAMQIEHMATKTPGHEKSSMRLDQAQRQALFQRKRYQDMALSGTLRNTP